MTTYHAGFLYMSDGFGNPVEVINEARTAEILLTQGAANPNLSDVEEFAGCVGLGYKPCTMDSAGAVTEWQILDLDLDAAPWYGDSQASHEAWGFYIDEWTGIDGGHGTRTVMPRGGAPGGARFGPQSYRHRVMSLNIICFGSSDRGLTHLFRWLESTLTTSCSCESSSLWLREFCPVGTTEGDLEEGLLRADDVVLLEGPTWVQDQPMEDNGCFIRKLNVVLAVGNPCLYRVPAASATTAVTTGTPPASIDGTTYTAGCDIFASTGHRVTATVLSPETGLVSPIVTLSSSLEVNGTTRKLLPAIRIFGLADPAIIGSVKPCVQPRTGMMVVDDLPAGYEMVIDMSTGAAQVRDKYGDKEWTDGGAYIQPAVDYDATFEGVRTISFGQCASAFVVVEPAWIGPSASPLGTLSADLVSAWSVTLQLVTRAGCT